MRIKKVEPSVGLVGHVTNNSTKSNKDTYSANYLNDRIVRVSPTEPTTGEKVWIKESKNLIDWSKLTYDYSIDVNGALEAYDGYFVTDFIEIEPNTPYSISGIQSSSGSARAVVCWYDSNKQFIEGTNTASVVSPSNAKYARLDGHTTNSKSIQFEKGLEATEFMPYQHTQVFVKNDKDDYEEIKNNDGDYCVIRLSGTKKISFDTLYQGVNVPFDTLVGKQGNFSHKGNYIEIGPGISRLRITVVLNTAGNCPDNFASTIEITGHMLFVNLNKNQMYSFSLIRDVKEKDKIYVNIASQATAPAEVSLYNSSNRICTYLVVERIK